MRHRAVSLRQHGFLVIKVVSLVFPTIFSAPQHIALSALYAITRPSVSHMGDHTKTVEDKIMKFSPYGSPIRLVFAGMFHPEILMGPPERDGQTRVG